jgi:hypothetical protein
MNRNDTFVVGRNYRILPNSTHSGGQQYEGIRRFVTQGVDSAELIDDAQPDGDRDLRFRARGHTFYVRINFVEEITESDTPAQQAVTLSDAWKVGNEIQFSVQNVTFDIARLSVGCKQANLVNLMETGSIIKMDTEAKTVTLKATIVENPAYTRGVIHIPGGGTIAYLEAEEYFCDIKVIKKAKPDVTVTLTDDELMHLHSLVGDTVASSINGSIYDKLGALVRNR